MTNPKLTPFLREKIEAFMAAHRDMHDAFSDAALERADEAVARFDEAVEDLFIAARAEGFGTMKVSV